MKKLWPYLLVICALLVVQVGLLWVIHTNMVPLSDFNALKEQVAALQTPVQEETEQPETTQETLPKVTISAAIPQVSLYQQNDLIVNITGEAHNYTTGLLDVTMHVENRSDETLTIDFSNSKIDDVTIPSPQALSIEPGMGLDATLSFSLDDVINAGVAEWYALDFTAKLSETNLEVTIPISVEADAFYQVA